MELGQMLFSNSPMQEHEAYWASSGLAEIAEVIQEQRKDIGLLVSNYGEAPYESNVFDMRTYCWCDGEGEGHEQGCPPNFHYKPTNLIINWYKHCERGITSNQILGVTAWYKIVHDCLKALDGDTATLERDDDHDSRREYFRDEDLG
jgi:hypothetical protein